MAMPRSDAHDAFDLLARPGIPLLARIAVSFALTLTVWSARRRSRQALSRLTYWELEDVGISHADAASEASRWFWQD